MRRGCLMKLLIGVTGLSPYLHLLRFVDPVNPLKQQFLAPPCGRLAVGLYFQVLYSGPLTKRIIAGTF